MSELIETVTSWRLLLVAVMAYGFAPGFLLRLIVRLYPRDDPRRAELVAELYTVPRLWRPFWVAEQLETGLFEGVAVRRAAQRRRRNRPHRIGSEHRRVERSLTPGLAMIGIVADGLAVTVALTHLPMPGWSIVVFIILAPVAGPALVRARRRRRQRRLEHADRT